MLDLLEIFVLVNLLRPYLGLLLIEEFLELLKVQLSRNRTFGSRIFMESYLIFGNYIYKIL